MKDIDGKVLAEIDRDWRGFGFEVISFLVYKNIILTMQLILMHHFVLFFQNGCKKFNGKILFSLKSQVLEFYLIHGPMVKFYSLY